MGEIILRYGATLSAKEERENIRQKALWFLPPERVEQVIPAPSWKTVYTKQVIGKGFDENNYVRALKCGEEVKKEDKMIFKGGAVKIWDDSWKDADENGFIDKAEDNGKFIGIPAPDGQTITIEVQRYY